MQNLLVTTKCNCNNSMGLAYAFHLVIKVSNTCRQPAELGSNQIGPQPYIFYNSLTSLSDVIRRCE